MNRLRQLRKEANLSQRELEGYTGICHSVITMLETGRRSFKEYHIRVLCYFFEVTSDYLMGESPIGKKVHFGQREDFDGLYMADDEIPADRMEVSVMGTGQVGTEDLFGMGRKDVMAGPHVFRYVKDGMGDAEVKEATIRTINDRLRRMSQDDCEKVLRFIEDYM